jgi:hypothetical protein
MADSPCGEQKSASVGHQRDPLGRGDIEWINFECGSPRTVVDWFGREFDSYCHEWGTNTSQSDGLLSE